VHIKIKKGLNIPIKGKPEGEIKNLIPSGQSDARLKPQKIALNLWPFEETRYQFLKKVGEEVKIGEPILQDKACFQRKFVSPAAGTISEVKRGLKRRVMDVVIDIQHPEKNLEHPKLDPEKATKEEIIARIFEGGLAPHFFVRPFDLLSDPQKIPQSILIRAIESAPLVPSAEMQVKGHEHHFLSGLKALTKVTPNKVHLVYHKDTSEVLFRNAPEVITHSAEGPHPIGNASVHIQHINPIRSATQIWWVFDVPTVISLGILMTEGVYRTERIISIAGPAILPGENGFFRVRQGIPISSLLAGRIGKKPVRLVSGDPLMGNKVESTDYLGIRDYAFVAIPEPISREFLHFFRLGIGKYSFSRAYLSGHLNPSNKEYDFTTSLHGEKRAFIDPTLMDEVQPLPISTVKLVKAVIAQDFDLADELGLMEVSPEDFALTTFVDPSKVETPGIIKEALKLYAKEMGT
jgi:Na+-transporting NADH:ubiquinone oxidoreductase subunit A